jgi:NAD(P)-dependent dehydrogenase (short-subunit alcohol dehydrogenase family)
VKWIFLGAGGGIGRAVAVRFAQEGATVVATDRSLKAAEQTAKKLGCKCKTPTLSLNADKHRFKKKFKHLNDIAND